MTNQYEDLLPFCQTDSQVRTVQACAEHNSQRKAAMELGVSARNVERMIKRVKTYAAERGFSPEHDMDHVTAPTQSVNGLSTLYDENGQMKMQWVKTQADKQSRHEVLRDLVEDFKEDIPRYVPRGAVTKNADHDLLNCYVLTDYHLGMVAFEEQNGQEDWDTEKAETLLVKWFEKAIQGAPEASECVLMQLGDFMHTDNEKGTTPAHGHILDKDLPPAVLFRVAYRVLRKVIGLLEQKYPKVHIINAAGNHDPVLAGALGEALDVHYGECNNITVDSGSKMFHCYEFGDVSLFGHHGHKVKFEKASEVFVSCFRDVFGRTKYSYGHMGHYHHAKWLESNLMIMEQHRTLAAKDAHAAQGGYESGRDAKVITYHRNQGEVERRTISMKALQE